MLIHGYISNNKILHFLMLGRVNAKYGNTIRVHNKKRTINVITNRDVHVPIISIEFDEYIQLV